MSPRRLLAVARKEVRHVLRDRASLAILLFIPVFLLVMFGYAISLDVKHIRFGVLDRDRSPLSRALVRDFALAGYFDLAASVEREADFDRLMREEVLRVGLVIPPDWQASYLAGRPAPVQLLVDGSNSNTASAVLGNASAILNDFARRRLAAAPAPPLDVRPLVMFNPELRSSAYLVPGLIAFILVITAVVSTALSVVREAERGTLEQLMVSPVRGSELVIGKLLPYFVTAALLAVLILAASRLLFGVPFRGSLALFALVSVVFLVGCLGLGLLISTMADSQQVAFTLAVIITVLPSFILSGFVFPIRSMPVPVQAVTFLVPTRWYLAAIRGIMLRGAGALDIAPDLGLLVLFALLACGASMARLRRRNVG